MKTTEVTEMCPHCQNKVTVQWDVENDGYELYCPYCGFPIMLCSMCDARDGKVCDWEEIKGCKYSDERYRDYFYKNLSCENAAEIARSSRDNDIWIPVEERLPEVFGKYWATIRYNDGRISEPIVVDFRGIQQKYVVDTPNGREYETWGIDSAFHGSRVIAWRPYYIPERYRPERSSDEKE